MVFCRNIHALLNRVYNIHYIQSNIHETKYFVTVQDHYLRMKFIFTKIYRPIHHTYTCTCIWYIRLNGPLPVIHTHNVNCRYVRQSLRLSLFHLCGTMYLTLYRIIFVLPYYLSMDFLGHMYLNDVMTPLFLTNAGQ